MRQAVWGALALLAGIALAVALTPRPAPEELVATSFEDEMGAPSEAPRWDVGDAWRVQFAEGEPLCWVVVVEETDDGFRQGIWCETEEAEYIAANIAALDVRYIGLFDADLNAVAGEETTHFFDWPLEDGKTWETTWYGEDVEVTASLDEETGRYRLIMGDAAGDFLRYDYDPELGWWSSLRFKGGYEFRVHERVSDWERGAVAATAQTRFERNGAVVTPGTMVIGDDDALALLLSFGAGSTGRFEVRDPSGNAVYQQTIFASSDQTFDVLPAAPGTWTIVDGVAGSTAHSVLIRGIVYERY